MDNGITEQIINRLIKSIQHLEISVTAARERIADKFGEEHPTVVRLDEYFPSIQDQKKYIDQLSEAIKIQNFGEIGRLVFLINSMSYMIKEDAKDALLEMQGIACEIDRNMLH